MKKKLITCTIIFSIIIAGCKKELQNKEAIPQQELTNIPVARSSNTPEYVPRQVLVKFKVGISPGFQSTVLSSVNGQVKEQILTKAMQSKGDHTGLFLVNTSVNVPDAVRILNANADVAYAEPNYIYQHSSVSNDPMYMDGGLWGMFGNASPINQNQYGSQAAEAWAANHTGSSSVFIGVIDEGIMYFHEDLAANIWTNPFDPVDGLDNDGNGYVDDIHGWDFKNNDNTIFDGDHNGQFDHHGTHVAGTIGAKGGNGKGVAGVNWNVTIIAAKFLGNAGGSLADAIKAFDYFTDLKTRHGLNLPATSNSWGGGGYSQAMADAITRAGNQNILMIAAAHNSGLDNDVYPAYPATYEHANVISVAAIDKFGALAPWSNYGLTTVDIGAPGVDVLSTLPLKYKGDLFSSYAFWSGTSMATPHVSGAAALYASQHPGATAAAIKNAILSAALPTASLAGKTVTGGRLNLSGF